MMKALLSTLQLPLVLAFAPDATAQTPNWLWARSGVGLEYDQASAVACDPYGFVVAVGYFASDSITFGNTTLYNNTPGFDDMFVVKYDAAGTVIWAHGIGGDFDDKAYSVAVDGGGDILLAGSFASTTITVGPYTFTNAGSPGDILLVKYDANGNVLWATREGGPALEIPYAVTFDDPGNFIVAGRFSSNSITFGTTTLLQAGSMDVFVVKYDEAGNVLWATGAGGGSNDEAYALAVRSDGDIIVGGYYTQDADFGPFTLANNGLANIFLARCDATTGAFDWAQGYSTDGDERALSIALDGSDNIYAAGFFQGDSLVIGSTTLYSTSFDNGYIARFDEAGDAVWAQGINGRSKAQGITVHNNALFACGVFRDPTLDYGSTTLLINGSSDLFLLKSDLGGNPQWIAKQTSDGEGGESALAIAPHPVGSLAIAGNFNSDVTTFGPDQLVNSDGYDAFVILTGDAVGINGSMAANDPLAIRPNPAAGPVTIEVPAGARSVEVFDGAGCMVWSMGVMSARRTLSVELPELAPGLYQVRVAGEGRWVGKLVIEPR